MRDRLYRSRDDRVISGVAGGVADWLDIDPSLVRIAFVLTALAGGLGFVLYIVMAFVVPEGPVVISGVADGPGGPDPGSGAEVPSSNVLGTEAWATDRAARKAERRAHRQARSGNGAVIFGAILILVGGWFLARRYLPFLDGDFLGPVVLVLIGILLIGGAMGRSGGKDGTPAS
ncbi:MAG: PspC domain-containing protein [Candidatus Limnocylindrales bacterium]